MFTDFNKQRIYASIPVAATVEFMVSRIGLIALLLLHRQTARGGHRNKKKTQSTPYSWAGDGTVDPPCEIGEQSF